MHKSQLNINRDTSQSQVSLTVRSIRTEDMATYYCARDTVMGLELSPDRNLHAGTIRTSRGW
jgi:hypothetical protein